MSKLYNTIEILEYLINKIIKDGSSRRSLLEYLMNPNEYNENGYGKSMAYKLIKDANDKIEEIIRETTIDAFSNSLLSLEQQREKALKSGNDRLALDIQKEINKISGLYKERIEINGSISTSWGDEPDDE